MKKLSAYQNPKSTVEKFSCVHDTETDALVPYIEHRWELLGNYPVFNMVMVIYH